MVGTRLRMMDNLVQIGKARPQVEKQADADLVTLTAAVEGIRCAGCVTTIETALGTLEGVQEASVNFADSTARVRYSPSVIQPQRLAEAVKTAGYRLIVPADLEGGAKPKEVSGSESGSLAEIVERSHQAELADYRRRFWVSAILTVPVAVLGMGHILPDLGVPHAVNFWVSLVLATPVVWWAGWPFHQGMWAALRHRRADMNTLISIGTLTAYLFSLAMTLAPEAMTPSGYQASVYYETAAMIVTLILAGRWMEALAKGKE